MTTSKKKLNTVFYTNNDKSSLKTVLILMTIGIWGILIHSVSDTLNIFPENSYGPQEVYFTGPQEVYVTNTVATDEQGSIYVKGSVDVDNIVDINIKRVNGYQTKSYNSGHLGVSSR